MGMKKLQGADGLNFELQMKIVGMESVNLPGESLSNERGNDIVSVRCWGGRLSVFVNLPHAVRPNNVQPFQLSDCNEIQTVRTQVIEYIKSYLKRHLKEKYTENCLQQLYVTKMECNLTVKCLGKCKPKDIINLFEKAFPKSTVYKETDDNSKTHKKPERGTTISKSHEWVLKVYDKSYQQRKAGDLKVESNLVRVELVFIDRMLKRMYSEEKSLEDILTRKSIKKLIDQYQETLDEIYRIKLKGMLDNCVLEVFESLTISDSGNEISDTLIRCKDSIVDIEVLRKALKSWYKFNNKSDNSKRIISYYRNNESYCLPVDVLKTLKFLHSSTGKK